MSPRGRAAGVLDLRSVSGRMDKVAVLLNGDLKRCAVSPRVSLGLSQLGNPNMPGLGNKPSHQLFLSRATGKRIYGHS